MTDKKRDPLASKKLITQYKKVFSSADGQAVLKNLCLVNYIGGSTFVPGYPDVTAKNEGQRDAILRILLITKMDPEQLLQAIDEEGRHV